MAKVWSFIKGAGFMAFLALVGFVLSIYLGFFYEKKPHIVFTASQPTKVFDVHQALGGLEISYAGESLRGGQKNLWVMTVVLKNEGNAEVRKGDYDDRDPLGVSVMNGQLLEQPTFQSDNSYITKNINPSREDNSVHFAPVIIEPGDSITLNLLVLGSETTKPELLPTGKISGSMGLEIRNADDRTQTGVIKDLLYSERWWIQGLRGLVYTLLFIVAMVTIFTVPQAFAIPFKVVKDKRTKTARRTDVEQYRPGQPLSAAERLFTKLYAEQGIRPLRHAYKALKEVRRIQTDRELVEPSLSPEQMNQIERYFAVSGETGYEVGRLEDRGLASIREMSLEEITTILQDIEGIAAHLSSPLEVKGSNRISMSEFEEALIGEVLVRRRQ